MNETTEQQRTHMGATQPIAIRKRLFDGISIAQVLAAAAAAATSMLLASRIGIAGSVIGAAVSSMVTVVCSQLYRNALDASAEKLKAKQAHAGNGVRPEAGSYAQGGGADPNWSVPTYANGAYTARIAPTKLRARAAAERSATKRKIALASVLIAAVAVIVCAAVILLGTGGAGLGAKTPGLLEQLAQTAPAASGEGMA
ncbi:MAG: hypothetical protein Q4B77_03290 [Coriobacteriaceae bacterium]|nr:hypothetical protein [Coriobacteriaceae bacterium]